MKLGLITQVRNEIDIIETFLRHIDALFDVVYLLDHQSVDGTTEILKQAADQRPDWKYYFLNFKGKFQEQISNFFLKEAFTEEIDVLFFLDADEFLLFPDRETLETRFSDLNLFEKVGNLKWTNCMPVKFDRGEFSKNTRLFKSLNYSKFSKIVIPRLVYLSNKDLHVSFGNHIVCSSNSELLPAFEFGELLHIPIRSKNQAIRKAIISKIALSAISNFPPGSNYQFDEFMSQIANGHFDTKALRRFTHIYEQPEFTHSNDDEIERYWNEALHTSLADLGIAYSDELHLSNPQHNTELQTMVADALVSLEVINPDNFQLKIVDSEVILVEIDRINNFDDGKVKLDLELMDDLMVKNDFELSSRELATKLSEQILLTEQLQNKISDLEQEVLFYSQSKSWKFTRPLRKFVELLKNK